MSISEANADPRTDRGAPTLNVEVAELPGRVGLQLGPSRTVVIDQTMIDAFARITGDEHWTHCDVERAKRELPWKAPLAHGYLLLSLITRLMSELININATRALNYGLNRLRFTAPVPAGARVRLFVTVRQAEPVDGGGIRLTSECRMEMEGSERPAFVAETMAIFYP
jgi:acyl dehydratase